MNKTILKIRVAYKLGLTSIYRYIKYKLSIRLKINKVLRLEEVNIVGKHYFLEDKQTDQKNIIAPDWFSNEFNGKEIIPTNKEWWEISHFSDNVGDIKGIWEKSRFSWSVEYAIDYLEGNKSALTNLNYWISDWSKNNPVYKGYNWVCGQECAIRIINLSITKLIFNNKIKEDEILHDFIYAHLCRIVHTIDYSFAQNNNHGTSEAAAIYIGSVWLKESRYKKNTEGWIAYGKKLLENRAKKLIEDDGTFSQYSTNYHRLMLDSMCAVELFRRFYNQQKFNENFYQKLESATYWLYNLVMGNDGEVPNLGANDGAYIFRLTKNNFSDFRPTVILSSILFCKKLAYPYLKIQEDIANLLNLKNPKITMPNQDTKILNSGGFAVIHFLNISMLVKLPVFKHRPSQCDILNVDLWINKKNILRDGGSFSYNTDQETMNYFSGVKSHNTVEFDGRNQMPKISRFLYGEWPDQKSGTEIYISDELIELSTSYKDYKKSTHLRKVFVSKDQIIIDDDVRNFNKSAIVNFRLPNWEWKLNENVLTNENEKIKIIIETLEKNKVSIGEEIESLKYNETSKIKSLKIKSETNNSIKTTFLLG